MNLYAVHMHQSVAYVVPYSPYMYIHMYRIVCSVAVQKLQGICVYVHTYCSISANKAYVHMHILLSTSY